MKKTPISEPKKVLEDRLTIWVGIVFLSVVLSDLALWYCLETYRVRAVTLTTIALAAAVCTLIEASKSYPPHICDQTATILLFWISLVSLGLVMLVPGLLLVHMSIRLALLALILTGITIGPLILLGRTAQKFFQSNPA